MLSWVNSCEVATFLPFGFRTLFPAAMMIVSASCDAVFLARLWFREVLWVRPSTRKPIIVQFVRFLKNATSNVKPVSSAVCSNQNSKCSGYACRAVYNWCEIWMRNKCMRSGRECLLCDGWPPVCAVKPFCPVLCACADSEPARRWSELHFHILDLLFVVVVVVASDLLKLLKFCACNGCVGCCCARGLRFVLFLLEVAEGCICSGAVVVAKLLLLVDFGYICLFCRILLECKSRKTWVGTQCCLREVSLLQLQSIRGALPPLHFRSDSACLANTLKHSPSPARKSRCRCGAPMDCLPWWCDWRWIHQALIDGPMGHCIFATGALQNKLRASQHTNNIACFVLLCAMGWKKEPLWSFGNKNSGANTRYASPIGKNGPSEFLANLKETFAAGL